MKQTAEQLIRADKLETLAKLLAKSWFYGDWEWETPNERIMQMLMQDLGYYPFKSEDEMIQQTRVDEDLYKEAVDKVELRNPRLMPVENYDPWDEVINQLGDTNEMIDHVGEVNEMVNHVPGVGKMVSNSEIGKKRWDDWDEFNKKACYPEDYQSAFADGFTRGAKWVNEIVKETLYTEEQVREVIRNCFKSNAIGFLLTEDDMIRTIKQPKQ